MDSLAIAQQIKIIKAAGLVIPVYRAPTEEYDHDHPSKFDKHVCKEDVQVNITIGFLLRTIEYLCKELILTNNIKNKELWQKLRGIKKMLESQSNTQPQYNRSRR